MRNNHVGFHPDWGCIDQILIPNVGARSIDGGLLSFVGLKVPFDSVDCAVPRRDFSLKNVPGEFI